MISYLKHNQIDKVRWDECIAQAPNGNVYAGSWYLDVVHPEWEALVEIDNGKYLKVMPLTRKSKYGINYLCQPFFAQQLGVFSITPLTEDVVTAFLKAIPSKYRLVEIRLNEGNPVDDRKKGITMHKNHLLDLHDTYEILVSHYHDNTLRNLKKSFKYNLQLLDDGSIRQVIGFFRADRGATVKHWGDAEYARLERLTEAAITSSNAFIKCVKDVDNNNIICGALFVKSHGRITFLFSGNSEAGKHCQTMTFLLDRVINEYAGQPLVLDFEGSDDPNLARFYKGFGGVPVNYPGFDYRMVNPFRRKI